MSQGKSAWNHDQQVARALLRDRTARRKIIARMLMLALALMAAGLWLVDGWLASNKWCFLLWWGTCALITIWVMLLALYDALAVLREERDRHR